MASTDPLAGLDPEPNENGRFFFYIYRLGDSGAYAVLNPESVTGAIVERIFVDRAFLETDDYIGIEVADYELLQGFEDRGGHEWNATAINLLPGDGDWVEDADPEDLDHLPNDMGVGDE